MEQLNIVELIENNPITKLTNTYNIKLLDKIKSRFTDFESHLFVSSFYCYLNYDRTKDFVIDLDEVWKWLGFSSKQNAIKLLERFFMIDEDYFNSLNLENKQEKEQHGGQNIKKIMLNIRCFKSLCLKAQTKKASQIHDYYINLGEIIQEVVDEESTELKLQLQQKESIIEQKDNKILEIKEVTEKEKYELLEKTILLQFPVNTECIYIGKIDDKTLGRPGSKMYHESLIKFGQSNELINRVKDHKKSYTNFKLIAAFKVHNKIEIENSIKRHPILKERIRSLTLLTGTFKELIALDDEDYTLEKIIELIEGIIKDRQYNVENYNLMIEQNYDLENEVRRLVKENKKLVGEKEELELKLEKYTSNVTSLLKPTHDNTICESGHYLYAFECEKDTYKCSIVKQNNYEQITTNLKNIDTNGEMKYNSRVYYGFTEKIMNYLLKQNLTVIGNNKFNGLFENVKNILDITVKIEKLIIDNCKDLTRLSSILDGNIVQEIFRDVPSKYTIPVDQINPNTLKVIATFKSQEEAGRFIGCTGSAIKTARQNNTLCKGFNWRISGISKEDQFTCQPCIKICCSTGEKVYFSNLAEAAKDANISAPGMRERIIREVHKDFTHWIFDKNSTHYKQ